MLVSCLSSSVTQAGGSEQPPLPLPLSVHLVMPLTLSLLGESLHFHKTASYWCKSDSEDLLRSSSRPGGFTASRDCNTGHDSDRSSILYVGPKPGMETQTLCSPCFLPSHVDTCVSVSVISLSISWTPANLPAAILVLRFLLPSLFLVSSL